MVGTLTTAVGEVPRVSARLSGRDRWGTAQVRFGFGRMNYTVDPGLYALGEPDADAPVLVGANYKLSFDHLRSKLPGRSAWLLVLDTKGINVWCAAGKGTFGTDELVHRLKSSGLDRVVRHRRLILPQLAGPGVAAHLLHKATGFTGSYGPVAAADLPGYLDRGCKATPAMRRKEFPLVERLTLVPVELVGAIRWALPAFVLLALLCGFVGAASYWRNVLTEARVALLPLGGALLAGPVLTPLLLPWLPGRAFAAKGAAAGVLVACGLWPWLASLSPLAVLGCWLIVLALASFWGMQFTGASTYTSLSGVRKEMRWAVPAQVGAGLIGLGGWLVGRLWY